MVGSAWASGFVLVTSLSLICLITLVLAEIAPTRRDFGGM
jgi:hypothetical protein